MIIKMSSSDVQFAICMATFQRRFNKSPIYLKQAFNMLLNQTYTNWKVFITGDKYEDNTEFEELCSMLPSDKIHFENLKVAVERENYKNKYELHSVAGCNAFNTSRQKAIDEGYMWICHLDDDDTWDNNRLEILNNTILGYPEACFLFNYSTHINNAVLPVERVTKLEYNNLIPRPANCIHSSYVFNSRMLSKFRFRSYPEMETTCGDIQFLNFLRMYLIQNPNEKVVFIPMLLTHHLLESEVVRDTE
jgi:hypothetical protein